MTRRAIKKWFKLNSINIENHLTGWYSCYVNGHTLKADTLEGLFGLASKALNTPYYIS